MHPFVNRLVGLALIAISGGAQASGPANGSFETGTLGGWFSSGSTAIVNGAAGYAALAGNHSAMVVAMSQAPVPPYSCNIDRWNFNCPQPLPFAASGASLPTHTNYGELSIGWVFFRGAFIGQDMTVSAGDVLSWNWAPGGEALGGTSSVDEARFYATNGVVEQRLDYDQGLTSFTFSAGGVWSVYFGLFQSEDTYIYSTVTLDNIQLTPVPEPASAALLLLGLVALGAAGQRRTRRPG